MESTRPADGSTSVRFGDYVDLFRPAQWIKNVVIFAGPAAGLRLFSVDGFYRSLIAFCSFCLVASATYAINDCLDREADMKHPTKRHRPIARGVIAPGTAIVIGILLFLVGVAIAALMVNPSVALVATIYFVLTVAYSLGLKRRVILDVIVIATGFVLRAWAGSLSVGVATSEWLIACIFTLCLFMGFGKRRCELVMMNNVEEAGRHRHTLLRYTPDLLNHLITVSAGIAIMTFLLYTLDATSTSVIHKEQLFFTLPIVIYGIFRYAMLSELGQYSGPTEIVLKDKAMLVTILAWAVAALVIVYQVPLLGEEGLTRWIGAGGRP
ncbi:MAG: decaprenyl-phosphate phosphoribosyltransferase [Planctomycetota bacterium]